MKTHCLSLLTVAIAALLSAVHAGGLETEFQTPPGAARPGVYWYFIDGNQDRDAMVADLHAMRDVGIGTVTFLEVDLGIPRGPVPFMSEAWQDNIAHAFVEAGKLGMEVVLGTGPGWSGSGGSWVGVDDSMQHLVGSSVQVSGPGTLNQVLPVPPPQAPNPFSGMNATHAAQRNAWFRDVAVIAYPTPAGGAAVIDELNIKTLKDVLPYSIRHTNQLFVRPRAAYDEPDTSRVIDYSRAVDLTSRMQPDGRIQWTIPAGNWTIMRFVARSTGLTSRPAPQTGHGFKNNKFDAESFRRHWNNYQKVLLERIVAKGGALQPGKGLTTIHLDSWEMSSQNCTETFRLEFQTRRGYDPLSFYPAWMGQVTGSREKTERFLWDMRMSLGSVLAFRISTHGFFVNDSARVCFQLRNARTDPTPTTSPQPQATRFTSSSATKAPTAPTSVSTSTMCASPEWTRQRRSRFATSAPGSTRSSRSMTPRGFQLTATR